MNEKAETVELANGLEEEVPNAETGSEEEGAVENWKVGNADVVEEVDSAGNAEEESAPKAETVDDH